MLWILALPVALAQVGRSGEVTAGAFALWSAQGAWSGAWVPSLWDEAPSESTRALGAGLGAAAGATAVIVGAPAPTDAPSLASASAWAVAGSALGAGIPQLVLDDRARVPTVAGMVVLGAAGTVVGTQLANRYDDSAGDAILLYGGQAWGAWQGLGWAAQRSFARPWEEHRSAGAGLVGYAVGAAYGLGTPLLLDLDGSEALIAVTAGVWGSSLGYTLGLSLGMEDHTHAALTLGLGDAALLATTIAVAGPWDPDAVDAAWLLSGGLVSGVVAAYSTGLARDNLQPVAGMSTAFTVACLAMASAKMASGAHRRDRAVLVRPHLPLPVRLALSPSPWVDDDGNQGLFVEMRAMERR